MTTKPVFTSRVKSLSVKTPKEVKQTNTLEVNPPEIVFKDIEINQIYQITVEIRNFGKRAVRIRLQKPTNPCFKIQYNLQEEIAPGLAMLAKIKYESIVLKNQSEKVLIATDEGTRVELPIRVYTMQSHLLFQPFVNMGFTKVGKAKQQKIAFKNQGKTKGIVSFSHNHSPYLSIKPSSLTIQPGQISYLTVIFKSQEAGLFKGQISLKSESVLLKDTIQIHATTVEFSRFFIDSNGQQQTLFDFGDMYVGQFSEITAYLINNGPKPISFKTIIRNGLKISPQEFNLVQSPAQLGQQQNQRILFCEPDQGQVKSFSQIKIKLICKSRSTYKDQIYTKNYALTPLGQQISYPESQLDSQFKPSNSHQYSIMFQFGDNDPLIVQMKGNTNCPLIKLQKNLFKFGDCPSHQQKQITFKVRNVIPDRKVTLSFPKIPNFSIVPNKANLQFKEEIELSAIFEPKNIGKFDTTQALVVNQFYEIPLRFFGISSIPGKKDNFKESLTNRSEVKQIQFQPRKKAFSLTAQRSFVNKIKSLNVPSQKILQLSDHFQNKLKFNMVLKQGRQTRIEAHKHKQVQQRWQMYTNKLKELGVDKKYNQQFDEQGVPNAPPIDYQFESGMLDAKLQPQRFQLPKNNQQLFVTKHIGPYNAPDKQKRKERYDPDQNQAPKKYKSSKPENHKQQRQIMGDLTSDQLQEIHVGPMSTHFGDLYVKCPTSKYFWVKNQTKKSILVRLQSNKPELSKSNYIPQIIPPCSQTGFEIVLCKDSIGDVSTSIKYVINQKYHFQVSIFGKIIPVTLELSENHLKYTFDESNLELWTTRKLILINNGNGKAFFKFIQGKQKLFVPEIMEGQLQSKAVLPVNIKFTAPFVNNVKSEYIYNQKLSIKTLDGVQSQVHCSAFIPECRVNTSPSSIDYGNVCIGKQINKTITFNNFISKYSTVANVDTEGYSGVQCSGKFLVLAESTRQIQVKFTADSEGEVSSRINIKFRGSKPKTIQCRAKIIKPNLIFQKILDFEHMIVMGYPGVKRFTLTNPSQVEVPLIIDLKPSQEYTMNSFKGVQCIQLKLLNKDIYLQPYKQEIIQESGQTSNMIDQLQLDDQHKSSSEAQDSDQDQEQHHQETKKFILYLKPKGTYEFEVKFKAQESIEYEFNLPWSIKNFGEVPSPLIKASGIQPKFIFDPQIIDFKKKIITTPDKCYPKYIQISVSNPDIQQVGWELDTTQFSKQQIFSLSQKQGKLNPGEKVIIKATFNPFQIGEFKYIIPLYLQSPTMKRSKYLDVQIRGTSSFPKLLFSKREVILPVVPLNILAETSFNVLNDGYENATIKYQVVDDVANLNLKLSFPDGNTLGLTRNKFKCEVGFIYPKPISFSIKMQFIDEFNRSYYITISGSTDNCLFTNYGFFLRNQGRFKIIPGNSLVVVETEEELRPRKTSAMSMKSNTTNKSMKSLVSYLGSNMIKAGILEYTISYLTRFLNNNVLSIRIQEFPRSFIENDGVQLFQILNFFTTKGMNFGWKCTIKERGVPKVKAMYNQYCELIKILKMEGAQLNHIRPEYLLSLNDLNLYLQQVLTPEQKKCYGANLTRVNSTLYNYLSMDSWISLLYQMLRIYFLFRLTPKSYKVHLSNSQQGKNIPDIPKGHLEGSNFLSPSQVIIIHWIEWAVSEVLLQQRKITNFEKDFKDGVLIGVLLQKYANSGILKTLKNPCNYEEDYKQNAEQICKALEEIGLSCHLIPRDIYNPLQRQMVLFLVHLYHYLPYYTPQSAPIEFNCVLGEEIVRTIELTNPSSKPVNYIAKYEGSDDFILLSDRQFRIEPKKKHLFQVKFVSRVSVPVTGKISFVNKKQNSIVAAAVVFNLKSVITGKISDKIWNISGVLYQQVDFPIDIINKFPGPEIAQFNVTIVTQYLYQNKKTKTSVHKPLTKQCELPTIFSKFDVVRLRKNLPTQFALSFIPTSMHTTKSTLIFSNFQVGEFQHEIIANVEPPPIIAEIRPSMVLSVDQTANYEYSLFFKNESLAKAKKAVEVFKKLSTNKRSTPKETFMKKKTIQEPSSIVLYVEIPPNPYISSKSQILLTQRKDTSKRKQDEKQVIQSENKLPLSYSCKNPVLDYSVIATLMNSEKTDVRRYRLLMTVQPKPLKAILEMSVPARGEITQNLPIVNNTEKDWIIKVVWEPNLAKNGQYFSIPQQFKKQFPIKKQSVGNFPLTFKPKWIQKSQAHLVLTNSLTMDQFEYQVRGIGEEPLRQEHIDIKCEAKDTIYRDIAVKNPYNQKSITFKIQTDLINCTVPATFTLPPGGKDKLIFTVRPVLCGQYTGSIILTEQNGQQYMWYTVTVVTNQPRISGILELKSEVRQAINQKIDIQNNTIKDLIYEVVIAGEDLYGTTSFVVKANSTSSYDLSYLPLKVGESKGTICFINDEEGQILYQIKAQAEQPSPKIIKCTCPLGTSYEINIQLVNPSNSEAFINTYNTNSDCFSVEGASLRLIPGQKKDIKLIYTPSSIDVTERAEIKFVSKQIGNWKYNLEGVGTPPISNPAQTIYNTLHSQKINIILFRNPFNYPITMGVSMQFSGDSSQVFKLLLKNKVQPVAPREYLQIPYSFIPVSCKRYSCKIIAAINSELKWQFPIVGITEMLCGKLVSFRTKCRQKQQQPIQIFLKQAVNFGQSYTYTYKLDNIPKYAEVLVQKFFTIHQNKNSLNSKDNILDFEFFYKPLKPSNFVFQFIIEEKTGPRWRYKISLEALQPEVDDIIEIQSPLLVTTSVAFKLTNRVKSQAEFTSKFTSDSANEFSVDPKEGMLPAYNHEGKRFVVSFTPIEYGKQKKGKLIIQTESMYWSYLLKGNLPKYNPPKLESESIKGSRVKSISIKDRSISKN